MRLRMIWSIAAGLLAVASVGAQQEIRIVNSAVGIGPGGPGAAVTPMPLGNGIVVGQAVDADSKRPISGALVTLSLTGVAPLRALADGEGRFAFRDLPKGSFNLTATKAGYVDGASGRLRPAGPSRPVDLGDGERITDLSVLLWRYAAIAGTVVDERNEPVVGATVRVLKRTIAGGKPRLVLGTIDTTDDRGMYRIGTLEPGEYVVAIPMTQSAFPVNLDALMMGGGEIPRDLMASISGGNFNFGGGGIQIGGSVLLQGPGQSSMSSAGTAEDGSLLAYQTTFYPGAVAASRATSVALGSGEERLGIDFQLRPVRTAQVSGTLMGPEGPAANLSLSLIPAEADDFSTPLETATTVSEANGSFTFAGVPAGQYVLRVVRMSRPTLTGQTGTTSIVQGGGATMTMTFRSEVLSGGGPPLPTEPTLWAEMPVSVGGSGVADLMVSLRQGARVTGQVEFTGGATRPAPDRLSGIQLSIEPADGRTTGGPMRGRIETNGSFATMSLPAGKYVLKVANEPQGWSFRGAMLGGRDVSGTPLDVEGTDVSGVVLLFTDRPAEINGSVTSAGGSPDAAASVIAFPTESESWTNYGLTPRRLRNVRTTGAGAYRIQNLPPGEYFVAAVADAKAGNWQDPAFLEALSRQATRVRLGDGSTVSQNLRTVAMSDDRRVMDAAAGLQARESDSPGGPFVGESGDQEIRTLQQPARDATALPAATGKASLAGTIVTDEQTPAPMRHARVTAASADGMISRTAVTDDAGRFSIPLLAAGRYTLTANKPGYVRAAYGAKRFDRPGTPITLADGQQMANITMRLPRGAVITGMITDEQGVPAAGASIRLLQYRMQSGERTLMPVLAGAGLNEQTDDRGVYRVFGLPPGEYILSATPLTTGPGDIRAMTAAEIQAALRAAQQQAAPATGGRPGTTMPPTAGAPSPPPPSTSSARENGPTVGYGPVYYPGTMLAPSAAIIAVSAGEERTGVDLQLQLVRTAKIEGTVVTPEGIPASSVQLLMVPTTSAGWGLGATAGLTTLNRAVPGADGKFSYSSVTPGQYTITARTGGGSRISLPGGGAVSDFFQIATGARAGGPGGGGGAAASAPSLWALADVTVDGQDLSNLVLTLQQGMTVSGRIVFEGASKPPADELTRTRVSLLPALTGGVSLGVPAAQVDASGKFTFTGVTPGRYRLSGTGPSGWTLKSALAKGADALDFPIEIAPNEDLADAVITFSDRQQEVSGTLQDPAGRPAPDFTVVLFAADNKYWTGQSRRIRTTRPGTDGKFSFANIPAGEYRLAALIDIAPGEANDPAFLQQLVAASFRFTLAEGEKKVQDLRLSGGT